jgi:hypothetical protein
VIYVPRLVLVHQALAPSIRRGSSARPVTVRAANCDGMRSGHWSPPSPLKRQFREIEWIDGPRNLISRCTPSAVSTTCGAPFHAVPTIVDDRARWTRAARIRSLRLCGLKPSAASTAAARPVRRDSLRSSRTYLAGWGRPPPELPRPERRSRTSFESRGRSSTRAGWRAIAVMIGTVPPRVAGTRLSFGSRVRKTARNSLTSDSTETC